MLTLEDLDNIDPTARVEMVTLAGQEFPVRGVSAVEADEIDTLFPLPEAPLRAREENGRAVRVREVEDPEHLRRCEAVQAARVAVRAAVAVDLRLGDAAWSRESIRPIPREARVAPGPAMARMHWADRAAAEMARLGWRTILDINAASQRAER